MEIGWPSNVRHAARVTFDRFSGFLGLPAESEPEVPRRALQCQAEGIFPITAGNSQEEYVRDQLNRGVVPEGLDVHCLAGLIKAWLRELPTGVLDSVSPEQVMQSETEEECGELVKLLPPTEAALLKWVINLMADVAQFEHLNKMNARTVAMGFAPNMTHEFIVCFVVSDGGSFACFLRTLIATTLREREREREREKTAFWRRLLFPAIVLRLTITTIRALHKFFEKQPAKKTKTRRTEMTKQSSKKNRIFDFDCLIIVYHVNHE